MKSRAQDKEVFKEAIQKQKVGFSLFLKFLHKLCSLIIKAGTDIDGLSVFGMNKTM